MARRIMLGLLLGTAICATFFAMDMPRSVPVRGLTLAEMGTAWGGVDCWCEKTYKCNTSFTSGNNKCAKCADGADRKMCCSTSIGTPACSYIGPDVCQSQARYVGDMNGGPGTCQTCTAASFVREGDCATLVDGSGNSCSF